MSLSERRAPVEAFDLGLPRLYREELVQIAKLIEDECDELEIAFHDDRERTGDRPTDFADYHAAPEAPERLDRLTLTGRRGTTELTAAFAPKEARVLVTAPDQSARGTAGLIRDLCRRNPATNRRRRTFMVTLSLVTYVVCMLFIAVTTGSAVVLAVYAITVFAVPVVSVGALYLVDLFGIYPVGDRVTLINAPRALRPTHLQKYGRTYLSHAVSLALGGIIGYVVNQFPSF